MTRERSSSFYGTDNDERDDSERPLQKINFPGLLNITDSHMFACLLSLLNSAHQSIINTKPVIYAYDYLHAPPPRHVTQEGNVTCTEFKVRLKME